MTLPWAKVPSPVQSAAALPWLRTAKVSLTISTPRNSSLALCSWIPYINQVQLCLKQFSAKANTAVSLLYQAVSWV